MSLENNTQTLSLPNATPSTSFEVSDEQTWIQLPAPEEMATYVSLEGSGKDSRSYHLTANGLGFLEKYVSNYCQDYRQITTNHFTPDNLNQFISDLDARYKHIKPADRNGTQWFFATAAKLYRSQQRSLYKRATETGTDIHEVSTNVFSLLVDLQPKKQPKLTTEGRYYVKTLLNRHNCLTPDEGYKPEETKLLCSILTTSATETKGEEAAFYRQATKSVERWGKNQLKLSATEFMAVSNSPWYPVIQELKKIDQFKQLSPALVRTVIAPFAETIFKSVSEFSQDDLEQSLLIQTLAEQVIGTMPKVITNQTADKISTRLMESLRIANNLSKLKSSDDILETALCRARFQAEMPDFLIQQTQDRLQQINSRLTALGSPNPSDSYQLTPDIRGDIPAGDHINPNPDTTYGDLRHEQQTILRELVSPHQSSDYLSSRLTNQPNLKTETSPVDPLDQIMGLRREQQKLIQELATDQQKHDYLKSKLSAIYDRFDLANELDQFWTKSENLPADDSLYQLEACAWLPPEYREVLDRKKSHQGEGFRGKVLGLAAKISQGVQHLLHPHSENQDTWLTQKYQESLSQRAEKNSADYQAPFKFKSLLGLVNLSRETETHGVLKAINFIRLFMIGSSLSTGAYNGLKLSSEAGLSTILESPVHLPPALNLEAVKEFFQGFFSHRGGLTMTDQAGNLTQENARKLDSLAHATVTPTTEPTHTPTPEATATQAVTPEPVIKHETTAPTFLEYLFGPQSEFYQKILAGRLDHLEHLSPDERREYLQAIGGVNNLDNHKICLGVVGEDRKSADTGDIDRTYPYGHADQTQLFCYDADHNTIITISFPRHLMAPANQGYDLAQIFWRDNPESQSGRTSPQGLSIMEKTLVDATGLPNEGVVSFSIDGAGQFIDLLFPHGLAITIEPGAGFVPDNKVLGQVTGYSKTGYKPFNEGTTYHLNGEELVAFVRSRSTSEHGYYDRESRAGSVFGQLVDIMINNLGKDPVGTISHLSELHQNIQELEKKDVIRNNLNFTVIDPDPEAAGQPSHGLGDIFAVFTGALLQPANLGTLLSTVQAGQVSFPKIDHYTIGPFSDQKALRTEPVENTIENIPLGATLADLNHNPGKYWQPIHNFFQTELNPTSP